MSRRCTSLAGDPSPGHRSIKILRFRGPPILGPCKDGVLRPVRHAQRIAPIHAKRHILADRWHLGIIRAKPLESIIILGAPVCKALQRPVLALISLIDHVITPLLAQSSPARWFQSTATSHLCCAYPVSMVAQQPQQHTRQRLPAACSYCSQTTSVLPQNGHGSSFKSPTPLKYCVFIFLYAPLCCFPALSRGAGGYNLFCGEVYRLPLDLCQRPGGLAAIVGDGCAL